MIEYIPDDDAPNTDVDVATFSDWVKFNNPEATKENDPFKITGDDLKKVSGLGPAFKRKMSREFSKAYVGIDGAKTQQNLLAQAITGYAMFDLIQPMYNLEYLARIYEISPFNYAAINAKVENIVGLGYQFVESRKTKLKLEAEQDTKKLDFATCKI